MVLKLQMPLLVAMFPQLMVMTFQNCTMLVCLLVASDLRSDFYLTPSCRSKDKLIW